MGTNHFRYSSGISIFLTRLFRISSLSVHAISIGWINTHPLAPIKYPNGSFAGPFKFLTYWNLVIQFILFTLIVYCDFFIKITKSNASTYKSNVLIKLRDIIHHGLALPFGLFVPTIFWTIYYIDRELIYKKSSEPYFPQWLNFNTHTIVGISVLIEEVLYFHPRDSRKSSSLFTVFSIIYFFWLLYIRFAMGFWVYPLLETTFERLVILFVGFGMFLGLCFFSVQRFHSLLWGKSKKRKNN